MLLKNCHTWPITTISPVCMIIASGILCIIRVCFLADLCRQILILHWLTRSNVHILPNLKYFATSRTKFFTCYLHRLKIFGLQSCLNSGWNCQTLFTWHYLHRAVTLLRMHCRNVQIHYWWDHNWNGRALQGCEVPTRLLVFRFCHTLHWYQYKPIV